MNDNLNNNFDDDHYDNDLESTNFYQEENKSLDDEEMKRLNLYRKIVNIWCIITISLFVFFLFYFLIKGEL